MKRLGPILIALFAAIMIYLVRGTLGLTAETSEPISLPENWNAYHRTFLMTANEAMMAFIRQHTKKIPIRDGARAGYENGPVKFEIWVATGASEAHAAQMVQDMTAKIGQAHNLFSEPKPVDLGGFTAYKTMGEEKVNFYYAKAGRVYWLGMNAPDPEALAKQIHDTLPDR